MFDISWIELVFVAVLALVIIGPKDLPKLFQTGGKMYAKGKRMLNDVKKSITQLEREVNIDAGKVSVDQDWRELLPKEIQNLPDDFIPGSMTAEQHEQRREQISQAKLKHSQQQAISSENIADRKQASTTDD
jgi:sec-independent protein translocase protein TatB